MLKHKRINIILVFIFTLLLATGHSQQLVINEYMSDNYNVIEDEFGDNPDWIEIFNPSQQAVNLFNWSISDDLEEPEKWIFPEVVIEPQNFLLIFASGRDTCTSQYLHTNFKIKSEGETLILCDSNENIIDQADSTMLESNQSYGRLSDGSEIFEIFYSSSPGASNINNTILNNLTISHQSGFYTESLEIEIYSSKPNDVIHYTLDGSCPTIESPVFEGLLQFTPENSSASNISLIPTTPLEGPWQLSRFIWKTPDENMLKADVIRYRSFSGEYPSSNTFSESYILDENIFERFTFPIISLITDSLNLFDHDTGIYIPGKRFDEYGWNWWPNGNYINNGDEWERYGHMDLFEPNGELFLSQDCGIRISGGWSAAMPQKSLRITAYNKYGNNRFNYPFFEQSENDEYKNIVLRNSGNDFIYVHFRDAFMQSLLKGLDMELQAFRPSVVFINGNYWGIHGIREKYDEHYFNRHFNIDEDSLIVVKLCGAQEIGDNQDFHDLTLYMHENSPAIQSNYEYIETRIDIQNFIDYNIAEIYFGNNDWPCNNKRSWRTLHTDSKWRWLIYDLDFGFGHNVNYQHNFLEDALAVNLGCDCSTFILRSLLENDEFKQQFIDRYAYHLNNTFHKDTVINKIIEFVDLLSTEMQFHIQRWHYPDTYIQWEDEIESLIEFATLRPCYCTEHVIEEFELEEFGFECNSSIIDSSINSPIYSVYPNPATNILFLENHEIDNFDTKVKLIDPLGRIVIDQSFNLKRYETKSFNMSGFSAGLYFLTISIDNKAYVEKLIIQ